MSNVSFWPIDRTFLGATTLGQSWPGSHGNEWSTPHFLKLQYCWRLTIRLFVLPGHSLRGVITPLQRCSRYILQPQPSRLGKHIHTSGGKRKNTKMCPKVERYIYYSRKKQYVEEIQNWKMLTRKVTIISSWGLTVPNTVTDNFSTVHRVEAKRGQEWAFVTVTWHPMRHQTDIYFLPLHV